ncbi:MAG: hypothetical protein R2828_26190 [Saprospiraceae bacterium]
MKTTKAFSFLFLILLLSGCKKEPSAFDQWLANFQQNNPLAYFEASPDSFYLTAPEELQLQWTHLDHFYTQLEALKTAILPKSQWSQRKAYLNQIAAIKTKWAACRNDPSLYNLPGYCKKILSDETISLPERLSLIQQKLETSPFYYGAAKQLIAAPLAPKTLLGAQKHLLGLHFLNHELVDSLQNAPIEIEQKKAFRSALDQTRVQVKDYLAFCESLYFDLNDAWGRE